MSMKLYVGGLPYEITDEQFKALFVENAEVISAVVIKDRDTGKSKGFGFVEIADIKDGQDAVKKLNGSIIAGRTLIVNQARPQGDTSPSYSRR